ncbi:MAG: hypothetical protein ACRD1C_13815 [Terriglobales bacterium]
MNVRRLLLCTLLAAGAAVAQQAAAPAANRFGVGFQASTLGPQAQFAVTVLPSADVRVGFSDFHFSDSFEQDGINYDGRLQLRSLSAQLDWFFWKSFHLSPGALLYNGNQLTATAGVGPGASFTLGGVAYTGDPNSPLTGTGTAKVRRFAPMFTVGSGRLVGQHGGHFGLSVEAGLVDEGAPQALLSLSGNVCPVGAPTCEPASSPDVQTNLVEEQNKLNAQISSHWYAKFYPILGLGLHFSF